MVGWLPRFDASPTISGSWLRGCGRPTAATWRRSCTDSPIRAAVFAHGVLDEYPAPDRVGYLAWQPHPSTGEDAPVGFALVSGLGGPRHHVDAFWTAPTARRGGLGLRLASYVVGRHPGAWAIAFQDDNIAAGHFWRRVADALFGPENEACTEERRSVPGKPDVSSDHWIESHPTS